MIRYDEDDVRDARGRPASYDRWLGSRLSNGDREFNQRNREREAAERRRTMPAWICDIMDLFSS